jgi:hypothetical protein
LVGLDSDQPAAKIAHRFDPPKWRARTAQAIKRQKLKALRTGKDNPCHLLAGSADRRWGAFLGKSPEGVVTFRWGFMCGGVSWSRSHAARRAALA